jgi:hypothetical protein
MRNEFIDSINMLDKSNMLDLSKKELECMFGTDFAVMKGYSQNNPHRCYDLLEHTLRTFEAIDCAELTKDEIIELKIAALYHDVGKPCVAFEKKGKTVFYNHAIESRRIADKELQKFDLSDEAISRILFYIEYHDTFISFKCPDETRDKNNSYIIPIENKTVNSKIISIQQECAIKGSYLPTYKDFLLLLRLCLADVNSQSNKVFQGGVLIDSREMKIKRLNTIKK